MGGIRDIGKGVRKAGKAVGKVAALPVQAVVAPRAALRSAREGFVPLRDAAETAAVLAGNYYLPGSSLLTSRLVSGGARKGLQSDWGKLAQIGTSAAGAWQGNLANYTNWTGGASAEQGMAGMAEGTVPNTESTFTSAYTPPGAVEVTPMAPITEATVMPTAGGSATPFTWSGAYDAAVNSARGIASPIARALPSAGTTANYLNLATGLYGIQAAQALSKQAQQAGEQADPFGPYRDEYAQKMAALERDPSLLTKEPGYEAGLEAVKRSMAAGGYLGSGNMMAALAGYGGDFYRQAMQRYASLAGAQFSPAEAANVGFMGQQAATGLGLSSLMNLRNVARDWNTV